MNNTKRQPDHARSDFPARVPVQAIEASIAPQTPVFDSKQLFGTSNEIGLVHEGTFYRLKITRQGKLILNK